MGNIGQKVAKIFQGGLGCTIVAYDPLLPEDAWADIPHTRAKTLEQLLETSDIVTLHIPLIPQTRNLIAYPQLSLMKSNAIIINTARGGIINEADLERALNENLIFGAGLDCHEQEECTRELMRLNLMPKMNTDTSVGRVSMSGIMSRRSMVVLMR
jgi:lactate dehydrogenase-like 2-hydroxyacid dehydrogenase